MEAGFKWGTTSGNLSNTASATVSGTSFSASLSGLTAGTTYFYQAYVTVQGTEDKSSIVQTFTGEVKEFTIGYKIPAMLETPATKSVSGYIYAGHGIGDGTNSNKGPDRNYNYCYDISHYAALWVAYPLTNAHTTGSASTSSWKYDSNIDSKYQPAITGNSYGTMYNNSDYSRGHQCPNASRKSDATMNSQTYYASNQTPQLQNKFNSGIWSVLENDVRALTTNRSDTLYVATGPSYQTVGGSEEVTWLTAKEASTVPYEVPLANYYWKAVLKIKTVNGYITDACAIGIWLEHKAYESSDYTPYIVSIDEIEAKTGFDLFSGLPDVLEESAEKARPTWTEFQDF